MNAVCKGDQLAYQQIVKQHIKQISHYAFRLLGNSKDTQDITQEAFLKLWTNAESWNSQKAKLSTWLHRITHNLCVDYLRKHGRTQTQESFDESEDTSGEDSEASSFSKTEKVRLLKAALDELPENQRSAIALCNYQNFSNRDAAAIMDISVKALESLLARAKRTLKQSIANTKAIDTIL